MSHANAKLTFAGRRLIVERILCGWTQAQAAEAQGVSRSTVGKWWKRFKAEGDAGRVAKATGERWIRGHTVGRFKSTGQVREWGET